MIDNQMREVGSVKALRQYLDACEAEWTDKDREMLGEFEDQAIKIPSFREAGDGFEFAGLSPAYIGFSIHTWFVIADV